MRYCSAKYDAVAKKAVCRREMGCLDACPGNPKKNLNLYGKMRHTRRVAHNYTKDTGRLEMYVNLKCAH